MSVPINKDELKSAIISSYEKLKTEISTIPEDLAGLKELDGHSKGTLMSINNLMAYLVGWGELVLNWNSRYDANKSVDFPETGYKWNELGKLAQKFYEDYNDDTFEGITSKLDQTVSRILQLIDAKTNNELYEVNWYGKWTLGRMIQFNTSSPYVNARGRIRKWKKERRVNGQ